MRLSLAKASALLSGNSILPRGVFFLLIGVSLLRKLFDPDVWWHMVVGREVMRQMHIPDHEFYILPRLGEPGEFHEWGFGVFYYLVEHYFGHTGMAIANAAIGCGILLCLYLAAHSKEKPGWWQSLPVIALALWVIEPRLNFRPETWLFLLLAAEILLLENYLVQKKFSWLIPLPFFTWLLSQGHPSAVFLIGVFGIYALQAVFSSTEKIKTAGTLSIVMLAMSGAATLNPYGLHQLLMPFYMLSNDLLASITEFLPVLETEYATRFIVIVAVGAVAILLSPQRRLVDILLFLVFTAMTIRYARNIALLGIVTYIPVHNAFTGWIARLETASIHKKAMALFSVSIGIAGIVMAGANAEWGVGIYEGNTPYKNAQLIKRLVAQGNILNFFHLGNYLAWELDRPVFIDGRNYNNEAVKLHDAIFRADPGWQNVIQSFDIQIIVTPVTMDFSGEIIPLLTLLENDPDWVLVGREKAGLMFVKNTGQKEIAPLPKNIIWHQAIEELNDTIKLYSGNKEAYRSLSYAYGRSGDTTKQRYFLEKSL